MEPEESIPLAPGAAAALAREALMQQAAPTTRPPGSAAALAREALQQAAPPGAAAALARDARLRKEGFHALLRQDMGFFDAEEHSAGALTSFLSEKVTVIEFLTGGQLQAMIRAWQHYASGVLRSECHADATDHSVLVVGYDRAERGRRRHHRLHLHHPLDRRRQ